MQETIEIRLEQPIEHFERRYESLCVRRPTADEISFVRRKRHTRYLRGLHLTASSCSVPAGVLMKLCEADAERIGVEMNAYLDAM